uniref:Lmo0105 protein n=1 Tax=Ganoderma boninense TaxID=34458 RepID=A0A5K1K5Z6_9APHY|nr:Lmo0105 protein [Ganoderma boninense]
MSPAAVRPRRHSGNITRPVLSPIDHPASSLDIDVPTRPKSTPPNERRQREKRPADDDDSSESSGEETEKEPDGSAGGPDVMQIDHASAHPPSYSSTTITPASLAAAVLSNSK